MAVQTVNFFRQGDAEEFGTEKCTRKELDDVQKFVDISEGHTGIEL